MNVSIDYEKLIADCFSRTKHAQGTRGCVQFKMGAEWFREQVLAENDRPVDMVLHCPKCHAQHIDAADDSRGPIKCQRQPMCAEPCGEWCGWTNPPHRSHLCHECGNIWRPADIPTNGVAAVKTKGKHDSPL